MNKRSFRLLFIFTPVGGIFFVITFIMLIRSLLNRNSYEIVLSCAALLFLLIFGIIGAWKSQKLKMFELAWKPPLPMTADFNPVSTDKQHQTLVTGLEASVPLFFRLHFFIRGRFHPCGVKNSFPVLVETSVPRGDTTAALFFGFPISGVFQGDGFCELRDIFGFFSFNCGQPQNRNVNIRSAPCFGKKTLINPQTGAEDQQKKPAADIERYLMREYSPGDRFRDINWKSSDKIDTLITRISTDNQEKISRIEVLLRNYCPANIFNAAQKTEKEKFKTKKRKQEYSLESLWLLDRAKARLSYFLRSLMEQNSTFILDVRTACGNWEIENQDDLDVFLDELAGLSFSPSVNEMRSPLVTHASKNTGDMYVFSTACDIGLPAFLLSCLHTRPVNLFIIQPEINKETDAETLFSRAFYKNGCYPSVRQFSRSVKRLNAQAGKTDMFYAEIKL